MRQEKQRDLANREFDAPHRRAALWYIQHEGSRFYIRLTPLGMLVAVLLTLIPIVVIISLFFINQTNQSQELKNINVTITPRSHANDNYPTIKPAPPSSPPPKVRSRSNTYSSNPVVNLQSERNGNER
jgi:hypothetical protein